MEAKSIKLIVERADKEITTWNCLFNDTVENIINNVKEQKNWIGGRFLEIYLEFDNNGNYYKVNLDIENSKFNMLLGGFTPITVAVVKCDICNYEHVGAFINDGEKKYCPNCRMDNYVRII